MKKNTYYLLYSILLFFLSTLSAEYQLISSLDHVSSTVTVDWSILICTLDEREQSFQCLYKKLLQQILKWGLSNRVEVIYCKDNRKNSVGFKRNTLLEASKGKYINFLDDDDDVHNNYISMIHSRLMTDPDCVSLVGTLTIDGKNPRTFIHSIKYDHYFEKDSIYYRPPNHLNTIRRSIAIQFKFPEINSGEDTNWAMQIARFGLLKKEEVITESYYFYLLSSKKH